MSFVTVRKNFVVVRADRRSLFKSTRSSFKTSFKKVKITKRDHFRRIHSV